MEILIRSGANIQNSIKRMIPLTAINLSGIVKIFVMVIIICGIRNTLYHPQKSTSEILLIGSAERSCGDVKTTK